MGPACSVFSTSRASVPWRMSFFAFPTRRLSLDSYRKCARFCHDCQEGQAEGEECCFKAVGCGGDKSGSAAELAEMVVCMQIAPTPPISRQHRSKNRMLQNGFG